MSFATLASALALAGLGFGIAVVPVTSVALAVVPPEHSGMAAGATTTSRELGSVVGVAVLGSLSTASDGRPHPAPRRARRAGRISRPS